MKKIMLCVVLSLAFSAKASAFKVSNTIATNVVFSVSQKSQDQAFSEFDEVCDSWKRKVVKSLKTSGFFTKLDELSCGYPQFQSTNSTYKKTTHAIRDGYQVIGQTKVNLKLKRDEVVTVNEKISGVILSYKKDQRGADIEAHQSFWYNCNNWKKDLQAILGENLILANCGDRLDVGDMFGIKFVSLGLVLLKERNEKPSLIRKIHGSTVVVNQSDREDSYRSAQKRFWEVCRDFMAQSSQIHGSSIQYISCGSPTLEYSVDGQSVFYQADAEIYLK